MQYTCCYGPKHVLAAIMTFTSHNDRFWNVFLFAFDGFAIIGPEFLLNQQVHQHRLQNTGFMAINTQHLGPFVNANLQTKNKMCAEVNNGKQNASMTMPSKKSHSIRKLYIYNNYHRQGDFRFTFYHMCRSEHFHWCKRAWSITVLHNRSKRSLFTVLLLPLFQLS